MIEIDGTAYPLTPGGTYLLVVQAGALAESLLQRLSTGLQQRYQINLVVLTVPDPANVRLLGASDGRPPEIDHPLQHPVKVANPAGDGGGAAGDLRLRD